MGREKRLCGMTGNTRALFLMKDAVNRCWVFTDACVISILDKLYGHSIIKNSRGVNRKIKKQGNFFSFRHAYKSGAVQRLHSATELVKKVFLPSSQTRPASLGSRLRGLRPAARIISAPAAQKFHTCRARRVFPDVHAAGKNRLDFICAVRGANSARLFDTLSGAVQRLHSATFVSFYCLIAALSG